MMNIQRDILIDKVSLMSENISDRSMDYAADFPSGTNT